MFKFLLDRAKGKVVKETQRQTAERALKELNDVLGGLSERPKLTVDMGSGLIEVVLPDQMPDEALALPAPEPADEPVQEKQAA